MKKLLLASALLLAVPQANATFLDAITGANGADITFEDNSREEFVDVDGNGAFNAGDQLRGFLRFDSFSPPSTVTNNDLYVTFTQTFGTDFTATPTGPGTIYSGSFSDVTLNFIDYTGAADYGVDDLSGGIAAAIADIESNGTVAFSAGLVNQEDFFAFQTALLIAGDTDFVIDPTRLDQVNTSLSLGNFAAGLTITANNIPVIFNRVIESNFFNGTAFGFGAGDVYDLAIVNGNFGGTCQASDGAGNCTQNVQNLTGGLVDNADAVVNATRIPEPTSLALLGLGLLGLSFAKRKA